MKSYLQALKDVSSLPIDIDRPKRNVADWQRVLMRGVLGFAWGIGGAIVTWMVSGDRIVGAILGAAAVFVLRHYLCQKGEKGAIVELSKMLMGGIGDSELRATYSSLAALGIFLLRPFCTYILLIHGAWLWLPIAALLGYSASLDCGVIAKLDQRHWIPAAAGTLLLGAIASKALPQLHGMFMLSLVSTALCWLLPCALQRFNLRFSAEASLYVCEAFALVLGMAALAM